MLNQLFIQVLGYIFTFIALPALAIIGIVYYRKYRSKGGTFFAIGAISTAIGSMFNKLVPIKFFLNESTHTLSPVGSLLTSLALIVHILGLILLVIGLGIITFQNKK
jgi:hypothetical protein